MGGVCKLHLLHIFYIMNGLNDYYQTFYEVLYFSCIYCLVYVCLYVCMLLFCLGDVSENIYKFTPKQLAVKLSGFVYNCSLYFVLVCHCLAFQGRVIMSYNLKLCS